MSIANGIVGAITYNGATDKLKVGQLRDALPNPDIEPANQKIVGFLDQMSPLCAAQLRVELANLITAVT